MQGVLVSSLTHDIVIGTGEFVFGIPREAELKGIDRLSSSFRSRDPLTTHPLRTLDARIHERTIRLYHYPPLPHPV